MTFIGRTRPTDEDYVIPALKLVKSIPEIGELISALRPAELNCIINIVSTRGREMIRSDTVDRNLNTIDYTLLELGDSSAMELVEIIAKEAATVAGNAVSSVIQHAFSKLNASFTEDNPKLIDNVMGNTEIAAAFAAVDFFIGVTAASVTGNVYGDAETLFENVLRAVLNSIPEATRVVQDAAETGFQTSLEAAFRPSTKGAVGASADGAAGAAANDVVAAVFEKVGERAAAEAVAGDGFARAVADVSGSHNVPLIVENPELVEAAQNNAKKAATEAAEEVLSGVVANEATHIDDLDHDVQNVLDNPISKVEKAIPYALHEALHAAEASIRDSAEAAADINDVVAAVSEKVGERAAAEVVAGDGFARAVADVSSSHNVPFIVENPELVEAARNNAKEAATEAAEEVLSGVVADEAARIDDLHQDVQILLDSLVSKVANTILYALREARHAAVGAVAEAAVGAVADINDVVAADALHNVGMVGSLSDFSSETESTASSSYIDAPESIASSSSQFYTPQKPLPIEKTKLVFVQNHRDLITLCQELRKCPEIAVDLEHHSQRSYEGITCLMQISTRKQDYIVDVLELRRYMHVLNEVFKDPKIIKVFHGASQDIIWLQRDFGIDVVNMFDTEQAAHLLNFSHPSLSYLVKHYCQVQLNKTFQLADWRIRPLPAKMSSYAREDTHFLLYIYDVMRNELINSGNAENNLLLAAFENSQRVCLRKYKKPVFNDIGYKELHKRYNKEFTSRQMYALQRLFAWRDATARRDDESIGFVLPNHMILQLAEVLPSDQQGIGACCKPDTHAVKHHWKELKDILCEAQEHIFLTKQTVDFEFDKIQKEDEDDKQAEDQQDKPSTSGERGTKRKKTPEESSASKKPKRS